MTCNSLQQGFWTLFIYYLKKYRVSAKLFPEQSCFPLPLGPKKNKPNTKQKAKSQKNRIKSKRLRGKEKKNKFLFH
ncbi:hypothetical protein PP707_08050 [Acetobacter pasteurianus]|nr:hypothetical protein [Acetobacter pasteurianus]